MQMRRSDLDEAVRAGVIDRPAAEALWRFLCRRAGAGIDGAIDAGIDAGIGAGTDGATDAAVDAGVDAGATPLDLRHLLWYAGGLIVIAGLGLFAIEASDRFGGLALAALAALYGCLFAAVGDALWRRLGLPVPGGLLVVAAVAMAPLVVFGIQDHFGWWSLRPADPADDAVRWIRGGGVPMALAAAAAAIAALRFYPFAFLAMVAAFALWFVAIDLAPLLAMGSPERAAGAEQWRAQLRGLVSIAFGVLALAVGWFVDMRRAGERPESRRQTGGRQAGGPETGGLRQIGDVGFWLHLAASLAMLGGALDALTGTGAQWAVLCALSVAMVLVSVFLHRRVHALFGAVGVTSYLVYLSSAVFTDILVFSLALAAIGIAIMLLGFLYHRSLPRLQDWLARHLPAGLQRLRPAPPPR